MLRVNVMVVLVVMLLSGAVATADITVISSPMDFQGFDPDPDFDNDYGHVWFTETTPPWLAQDGSDANYWYFRGRQEYSPQFQIGGGGTTWFQKTGDEEYMEVSKTIVNNTSQAFTGYTITLRVATLVDDSLTIDGEGYTMTMSLDQDYYGNWITTISIDFDEAILSGESFDLSYILDLTGVIPPPPPDGGFGDDGSPELPEPAALGLLCCGGALLITKKIRYRL